MHEIFIIYNREIIRIFLLKKNSFSSTRNLISINLRTKKKKFTRPKNWREKKRNTSNNYSSRNVKLFKIIFFIFIGRKLYKRLRSRIKIKRLTNVEIPSVVYYTWSRVRNVYITIIWYTRYLSTSHHEVWRMHTSREYR